MTTGPIWGNDDLDVQSLESDGSSSTFVGTPPDPDTAFDNSIYPGGSDGVRNYMLAVDSDSDENLVVDVFNADFTTLVDRWAIPGWPHDPADPDVLQSLIPDFSIQHVSASADRVVVIIDLVEPGITNPISGNTQHYLGVAVFDTAGTLLHQYVIDVTIDMGGGNYTEGYITGVTDTGSSTDGINVYFAHAVPSLDLMSETTGYSRLVLATGELDELFTYGSINAQGPDPDLSWAACLGIVVVDDSGSGDLILAGGDGVSRVTQTGLGVWFTANPDPGAAPDHVPGGYQALAHSGNGSVWATAAGFGFTPSTITHEFAIADGEYLQAAEWAERVDHSWLFGVLPTTTVDDELDVPIAEEIDEVPVDIVASDGITVPRAVEIDEATVVSIAGDGDVGGPRTTTHECPGAFIGGGCTRTSIAAAPTGAHLSAP